MKQRNKCYAIYIDLYNVWVLLYIGDTKKLVKNCEPVITNIVYKDKEYFINCIKNDLFNDDSLENFCTQIISENNECLILICVNKININNFDDLGIFCHETFHAANYILNYIGAKIEKDNSNEPFAYLQEYIFRELLNLTKTQKEIRK